MFKSIEQQLRDDANKYVARANTHIATGNLDKAIGCLNKAIRKINRANMLKMSPLEEVIFGPLMSELSKVIAKNIMEEAVNGKGK